MMVHRGFLDKVAEAILPRPELVVHSEKRIVPYTAEQYFDLVVDVEQYSKFLPWCKESHIIQQPNAAGYFDAELDVGFVWFG